MDIVQQDDAGVPPGIPDAKARDTTQRLASGDSDFLGYISQSLSTPPSDVRKWICAKHITCKGSLPTFIPQGAAVATFGACGAEALAWLTLLAQVPHRNALTHLALVGLIQNKIGFPVLTPFGAVVQVDVRRATEIWGAHPSLLTSTDVAKVVGS